MRLHDANERIELHVMVSCCGFDDAPEQNMATSDGKALITFLQHLMVV